MSNLSLFFSDDPTNGTTNGSGMFKFLEYYHYYVHGWVSKALSISQSGYQSFYPMKGETDMSLIFVQTKNQ